VPRLCLGVPRVMSFDSFWQEALATALAPARQYGASSFGPHAGTETMLALARAFGWLIGAFHRAEKYFRRDLRAVTVRMSRVLSIVSP
jgi:hypothetical protein